MKRAGRGKRIGGICLIAVLLAVALGAGVILAWVYPYTKVTMDMTLMQISTVSEPSTLLAYEPEKRAGRRGELHRARGCALAEGVSSVFVPYEEMPPQLICAFVAIEDKRFWEHDGVDLLRTGRAALHYLWGDASFGGSTITQQLVKNLTGRTDHSSDRKLTEIFSALDLERRADKTEILECYLNVINLAEGCYGVGMAAQRYFSKPVSDLTLTECAAIAAITNNPARYNPITRPEDNKRRRDLILRQMMEQGYISEETCAEALATPTVLSPSEPVNPSPITSWYGDLVVSDVIADLQARLGYSYRAASLLVSYGGLQIITAIDEEMQTVLEDYYEDVTHFPEGEAGRPQSSCILLDPQTGDVLAVAGAWGKKSANRLQNYATDTRRPAGSCIKPLTVYAPALEMGKITWASIREDEPLEEYGGVPWPSNGDGLYRGRVSVGQAMAHSINTVSVKILQEVGLRESLAFARDRLGLTSLLNAEEGRVGDLTISSLGLGQQSRGVSVRELTAAYTAFDDGICKRPVSYHRVLDREGNLLLENRPAGEEDRALRSGNASVMTRLLQTVTKEGTAARAITLTEKTGIETAGKTGTTQNNCDRWFVGYTPRLLAGVWMGYDYPKELRGIQGNPCVTIWDDLMELWEARYTGAAPRASFEMAEDVLEMEFCPLSGELINPYCQEALGDRTGERGWFVKGSEPCGLCPIHEEPPITVPPLDPLDPDRIPTLPNDVLPGETEAETEQPAPPRGGEGWYSRWFSFFSKADRPRHRRSS